MLYPDKFYLTQDLNRIFARTNLARLIFSDLHFEKTNISPDLKLKCNTKC